MKVVGVVFLVFVLLVGCTTDCPVVVDRSICPKEVQYTQDQRNSLAGEIENLPKSSALSSAMADYAGLRAQVRACRTK